MPNPVIRASFPVFLTLPLVLSALCPTIAAQTAAASKTDLLTDFDGGGLPIRWRPLLDGVMGGLSSGDYEVKDGVMTFTGVLNTNGGGFSSLRTYSDDIKLEGAEGIYMRVRGDGRNYTFRLQQMDPRRRGREISYRASFDTVSGSKAWQDVWLPFADFIPVWRGMTLDLPAVDPARVQGLGIMIADKIDGPFELAVDQLSTYQPFALKDLQDHHRVVVISAPSIEDPAMRAQLAKLIGQGAGMQERDTVLIALSEVAGESSLGARPLTAAVTDQIRTALHMERGAFAMRLVGKDGGVKHVSAKPVDLSAVFAKIDTMPMRQQEIRARGDQPKAGH